ncbi:MAG: ABC transporter substrate-binding protein [Candidatus Sedimenticola sp. (ex Thyasira tokunagai)]
MKNLHSLGILASLLVGILFSSANVMADPFKNLTFLTENYAPYNYSKDGKLQGISIGLMLRIFKRAGSSKTVNDIQLLPWARAYRLAQDKKNTVLFVMTRTKSRENMFKWVGPITPTTIAVIAKKSLRAKIDNFTDLNKYKIGAIRDDIGELLLKKNGLSSSNIHLTNSSVSTAKMLASGRIDMWAYESQVALWNLMEIGENSDDYEVLYLLEESMLYIALQKDTDDTVVTSMQEALDAVVKQEK